MIKISSFFPLKKLFFMADDILLKTIVRSNPGPVLMKGGVILNKWHYRKLPDFEAVNEAHLKKS